MRLLPRTLLPRTLLARTVLLIGLLLSLSLAAWLTLFNLAEREPRARQTAERVASVVELTRAALLAAQGEKRRRLLAELSDEQGIRILPLEPEELLQPPPESPALRLVHAELQKLLGEDTLLIGDAEEDALWVSFHLGPDDYWLILPRTEIRSGLPWQWLGWGLLTLLLSVAGGWMLVARINQPLKQTVAAAARIGQGEFNIHLPESGANEIAALGQAINRMSADLQRIEQDRALMLAGISHDLRTPLARLRLAVEMAVSDERERALMIADMDDMDGLTRQFLDFARGDGESRSENVDLDALVQSLQDECAQRKQPFEIQGTAGICQGDSKALRRALLNLIENAWRYGAAPVSLNLHRTENRVSLCVRDHGSGVDGAHLPRLTQAFYRVDSARTGAKGSGLGLAIVERIAQQHGGTLILRNAEHGGLSAELSLPIAKLNAV